MLRTIIVVIAGLVLSAVIPAAATSYMLTHTEFGRLMTGDSSGTSDRWEVFMSGSRVLFFYVFLPTVILVAFFVGTLAKWHALIGTTIAVLPICLFASGLGFRRAWMGVVLLVCAVLLAGLCQRLLRRNLDGRKNQATGA